jgi:hypothetical protein
VMTSVIMSVCSPYNLVRPPPGMAAVVAARVTRPRGQAGMPR